MSAFQPTASRAALLLQCPRPFAKDTSIDPDDNAPGEAALYGTRFHAALARLLAEDILFADTVSDELILHVKRAYEEIHAWMRPEGNPFNRQFKVVAVEAARSMRISKQGATISGDTTLHDPDGEHRYDMLPGEIAGTADLVLESVGAPRFIAVLDHKTGEYGEYSQPSKLPQMLVLAAMWGADAVAILHHPRGSVPAIYAEPIDRDAQRRFLKETRAALKNIDSGFMRTGSECRYCPARTGCPTRHGELLTSTTSLVARTLEMRASKALAAPVDKGRFHMMLSELSRLASIAREQLRDDVRAGEFIERPDGKTLALETRSYERLSKTSILEAYGKVEGERVLAKLRADGALTDEPREELRAK